MRTSKAAAGLAGLLITAGIAHFANPRQFDAIVPKALPGGPRTWTYVSGAAELALGAAVAVPKTRRLGALAAAAFFVAVFPANIKMAWDWRDKPRKQKLIAFGRLPLQVPLVLWALRVRRDAGQR